ncbi:hypothetical protein BP6252_08203 [Coleophoma cylindrospora]|uniref:Zn(2)-C6 fungal-type domain-containing protein n=1 Tax=Coleophoma cylindrospora TaxID=1849047 RepID=A0A3D8RCD4_9HELO|nr:hypothetical protein BP6252_08203 [Coleophoma cylindrospora]
MDRVASTVTSPISPEHNPRKRTRTACDRCKTRKQKCDNEHPACSNCAKASVECVKPPIEEEDYPSRYVRALEDRVSFLELKLSGVEPDIAADHLDAQSSTAASNAQSKLGEIVSLLSSGNIETPTYVGHSSGFALATDLGGMVQASAWSKLLDISTLPDQEPSIAGIFANGNRISLTDLQATRVEFPDDKSGERLLTAYFHGLHPKYPFLSRAEIWNLHHGRHELSRRGGNSVAQEDEFGQFKLFMVYAIGSMLLQPREDFLVTSPEVYYMAALARISAVRKSSPIHSVEAMVLLVIYHLRSRFGQGIWFMIGLAMRTCIDMGLHRRKHSISATTSSFSDQMQRRIFWTVYSLECIVAVTLGRPMSIRETDINIEFPYDVPDSASDPLSAHLAQVPGKNTTLSLAIALYHLRVIESRIHHSVYQISVPQEQLLSQMAPFYEELENWRNVWASRFKGPESTYPLLHYNRALWLLTQIFLPLLPPKDIFAQRCIRAAGDICQAHKIFCQSTTYGESFLAVHTVFVAGITLLYHHWKTKETAWSASMSNDIRACSLVLFAISGRAPWVRKYRDAFECLVGVTMERLQAHESGIQSAHLSSITNTVEGLDLLSEDTAAMVRQLEDWANQNGGGQQMWLPDPQSHAALIFDWGG